MTKLTGSGGSCGDRFYVLFGGLRFRRNVGISKQTQQSTCLQIKYIYYYSNALPLFKRSPIRHLQRDPLISFYLGELENDLQLPTSIHELEDKMEKLDHLQKRVYSDIFLYRKKRHQNFEQDLAGLDEDPIVEFYLDSFADGL